MLDFRKHSGLDRALKNHTFHASMFDFACTALQTAFEVFEKSKQALNEDNFVAALERNTLREFRTEELRQDAQRALTQKQQFLRLHYLGSWVQMAVAMGQLEKICRQSLDEEKRILAYNAIHEDEDVQTRFHYERYQMSSRPLAPMHEKWLALQDSATMGKCIKSVAYLYDKCINGCDDPAQGVALPKLPLRLVEFGPSFSPMMEWTVGGASFRYYCGWTCINKKQQLAVGLDEMTQKVKSAFTGLNAVKSQRVHSLAFIDREKDKARFDWTELQLKTQESRCELDFLASFDEAELVSLASNDDIQELARFIAVVRDRQKYLQKTREEHGQSIEWLASMCALVIAVVNLSLQRQSTSAWSDARNSKYALPRQEVIQRMVGAQTWSDDARLAVIAAVDRKAPLANSVHIAAEVA